MKKVCFIILISVLLVYASGCHKLYDSDFKQSEKGVYNEQSETNVPTEQSKKIDSNFKGVWYFTNYSAPEYTDEFEKIEIVPYDDKAKVLWSDGTVDVFTIISENEGIGPYKGFEKARYRVDSENGAEHLNVIPTDDGLDFQPGVGGYRNIPNYYKSEADDMKNKFNERFNSLSQKQISATSQQAMNKESKEVYDAWDGLLNEIYGYLKETMPKSDFEELQRDEVSWITQKENAIQEQAKEYEGDSMAPLSMNSTGAEYTKERCEYLISLIK